MNFQNVYWHGMVHSTLTDWWEDLCIFSFFSIFLFIFVSCVASSVDGVGATSILDGSIPCYSCLGSEGREEPRLIRGSTLLLLRDGILNKFYLVTCYLLLVTAETGKRINSAAAAEEETRSSTHCCPPQLWRTLTSCVIIHHPRYVDSFGWIT